MTAAPATARPATVGVRTRCCGQYARGTVRGDVAEGRCPRCGGRFRASLPKPASPPAPASR